MRRITKIAIDNFRAYSHPLDIEMPGGEDLLIYGENGSGKSSLYKALRYFLESSVDGQKPFEVNHFTGRTDGNVTVTYTDVDATGALQPGTEHTYTISTDAAQTTNGEDFIKTSHRASGFLDYSQLLKVYLNNGTRPNLFSLITDLLGNYVPAGIDSRTIKELIEGIEKEYHSAYHRTDYNFQEGERDFKKLEALFPVLISNLNAVLTPMMNHYFKDMGLEVKLVDAKAILHDPDYIRNIKVKGQVYVKVKHHGNALPKYNDRLNEARLSAIATCLYLSSLKLIANTNDTRVLFLDDVFIGLDLGNRLPVLDIIKKEFKEFQRIITTYDKSWYLQAKEVLEDCGGWKFYEMYEGELTDAAGNILTKPILVNSGTDYGRACFYLNDVEHPDYPASANYLRKAFEELLMCKLYDKAIRDENYEVIPAYRLTHLVKTCRGFVAQLPDYVMPQALVTNLLADLDSLLHPLLHPLSHHVPDIPTYKAELKKAMHIYDALKKEFQLLDYPGHCKVLMEKGKKIEFAVKGASGWENHYSLRFKDNFYRYDNNAGGKNYSLCELRAVKLFGNDILGKTYNHFVDPSSDIGKKMVYSSLQDCYNSIINHIVNKEGKNDIVPTALEDMFWYADDNNVMQPLRNL